MPISHRKPFKYKFNKAVKPTETCRTEMLLILRAFVVEVKDVSKVHVFVA